MSSINNQKALYICSPEDANQAFASSEENFAIRLSYLEQDGLASDICNDLDTLAKIDEYIRENYPEGLDRLYFRAHGNQMACILSSNIPDGKISMHLNAEDTAILKRICRAVKPGGFLITESCHNGKGKDNLLRFLAQFCHPNVAVIGNRGSACEVEFFPRQPKHHRYIHDGQDFTRIYFQTMAKGPVNISIRKLNILQKLLSKAEGGLDACYQFLGERKFQPERACEVLKEALKMVPVSRADVGEEWQEILSAFAPDLKSLEINPAYRLEDLDLQPEKISNIYRPQDEKKCAYLFLLGMAILEEHREIFALLEGDETPYGPLAQCIHALSNLAVHDRKGRKTILQMLDQHWSLIKNSYRLAVQNNLLSEWVQALIDTNDPCTNAYIDALSQFSEEAILNGCEYPVDDRVQSLSRISVKEREDWVEKAAKEGKLETLELLLSSGIISRYARGNAVLLATLNGNKQCVKLLLRSGEIPDFYRGVAAESAKRKRYPEILENLERSGDLFEWHKEKLADLSGHENYDYDPPPLGLFLEAKQYNKSSRSLLVKDFINDLESVHLRYTLASGEIEDDLRNKLVMEMAKEGNLLILELLLDSGPITRNARDEAIELAAEEGHEAVLKKLLNMSESPSELGIYRAAHKAIKKGHIGLVKLLLKSRQLSKNKAGELLLIMAEISDDPEIAKLLMSNSVSFQVMNQASFIATEKGHKNFVKAFIDERLLGEMRQLSVPKRERMVKDAVATRDQWSLKHLLISGEISSTAKGFAVLAAAYVGDEKSVQLLLSSGDIPDYHRAFAAMAAHEASFNGREGGSFKSVFNLLLPPGEEPEIHRLAAEIWNEKGQRELPTFCFQHAGDQTIDERAFQIRICMKERNIMHLRLQLASGEIRESFRDEMLRQADKNGDQQILNILLWFDPRMRYELA